MNKNNIIYILLCIITLGIYPAIILNNKNSSIPNKLSDDVKVTVNVKALLSSLGNKENISGVEYTHTKIKIFIKDKTKMSINKINEIKNISGIVTGSNYITILVGKQAKKLSLLL